MSAVDHRIGWDDSYSAVPPPGGDAAGEGTTRDLCSYGRRGTATFAMTRILSGRGRTHPVRVSVARKLGRAIDGAWWPRADRITNELPDLIATLTPLLGDITSINVNWQPLQRPPDFNWPGWEHKRQHVMTISGDSGCINLLIVSYATYSTLARMVLRCAADLPVGDDDRLKPVFTTAGSIVRAAQQQCVGSTS